MPCMQTIGSQADFQGVVDYVERQAYLGPMARMALACSVCCQVVDYYTS